MTYSHSDTLVCYTDPDATCQRLEHETVCHRNGFIDIIPQVSGGTEL